jgi:Flp pilus assembly secretin CpaC
MRTSLLCGFVLALAFVASYSRAAEPTAGKAVSVEVLIVDVATAALGTSTEDPTPEKLMELEKQGKLAGLARMKLASIENLEASVQLGEMVGVPTGRTFARGGGFGGAGAAGGAAGDGGTTSYQMRNIGTLLRVNPRVEQDGSILVELNVERSKLAEAPMPEGGGFTPGRTVQIQARTTLRVPPGKSVVTGGHSTAGKDGTQTWIIVSAKVLDGK